jgi:hypothetical protein
MARVHSKLGARLAGSAGDFTHSDIPRALTHLNHARELMAGDGTTLALGYLYASFGTAYLWANRATLGLEAISQALSIAEALRNDRLRVLALPLLGHFLAITNEPERGMAVNEEAWLAADEIDDPFLGFLATFVRVNTHDCSAVEKVFCCERELAKPRSAESSNTRVTLVNLLAAQLVNAGEIDRARHVLADIGDQGWGNRQLLVHDGRWEEAEQVLVNEGERSLRGGNQQNWANARKDLAELALLSDRTDRAIDMLVEAVESVTDSVTQVGHAASLVEVLALTGQLAEAKSTLSRFDEFFADAPKGSMGKQALRARAAVAAVEGSIKDANRDFALALRLFAPVSYRTEARTLSVWGASLIIAGHANDGARMYEQAAEVYRRVGAHARFLDALERDRKRAIAVAQRH